MSISNPPLNQPYDDRGFIERAWAAFFTEITNAVEDTPNPQTTSFTVGSSYRYLVDATAGDVTVTLPPVAGQNTKGYSITKTDSSTNLVIIVPDGSDTILGDVDLRVAAQYDTPDLFPSVEDSNWYLE